MIRTLSKTFRNNKTLSKVNSAKKEIVSTLRVQGRNDLGSQLIFISKFFVLQNAKRLQTFSVPQEEEIKPINKDVFNDAALTKIIRIEDAFKRIYDSELNQISRDKIKTITKNHLYHLEVNTDKGAFQFEAVADLSTFFYTSPISGAYKYYYSLEDQKFLNNKDKHILEECLTREVLDKLSFVLEL